MIRKIASVEHDNEEYELIVYGREQYSIKRDNEPMKTVPSWGGITVVKNDDSFEEIFKKERKKNTILSLLLLLSTAVFVPLFISTVSYAKTGGSLDPYPLIFLGLGLTIPTGVSIAFFILYFIKLINLSTGSFGVRYIKHLDIYNSEVRAALSEHSLISYNSIAKTLLSTTLKDIYTFIGSLSKEEIAEFIVKGYERGDTTADLRDIETILNNDKKINRLLKKDAATTANDLNDKKIVYDQIAVAYQNKFKNRMALGYRKKGKSTAKNSDERLLEILSKRSAS